MIMQKRMHNGAVTTPVRVAIVGRRGYAGAELVRLLAAHPNVELAALYARNRDDAPLADEFPHLAPLGLTLRRRAAGARARSTSASSRSPTGIGGAGGRARRRAGRP